MIDELHKLHEFAHWHRDVYVYDDSKRGRVACTKVPPFEGLKSVGEIIENIARAIEHTIASRYMELPVDADGAPIHVGDDLGVGTALYVSDDGVCIDGNSFGFWEATSLRHAKPETVEDVLRDFVEEWGAWNGCDSATERQMLARYAGRIMEVARND